MAKGIIYFQYASKSRAFGHTGYIVRSALACIDHNKNLHRTQVDTGTVYRYLYPSVRLVGMVPVPKLNFLALLGTGNYC
jgi:hypothetical protein